jgi:[ribosomal protein S5]-alanine N-acetyltransferase
MTIPIIETERLIIREYVPEDLVQLHMILSDPMTMSFWPAPFTLEQVGDWIEDNLYNYEEQGFGRWAIVSKQTRMIIGDCGINCIELDGQMEYDLGYIIHKLFWNEGYAAEAAEACKKYAFEELGLHRLCANMPKDHIISKRVAEKIGMELVKEFPNERNRGIMTYLYAIERANE